MSRQIDCRVITRAFLSVLLLTVLARPFMIGAGHVVWSPIAMDVVTDAMAFIEVMPEQASTTGQVNVTVTVYNVARLYAWQVGLEASLAVTTAAAIIPTESIFQNRTRALKTYLSRTPENELKMKIGISYLLLLAAGVGDFLTRALSFAFLSVLGFRHIFYQSF